MNTQTKLKISAIALALAVPTLASASALWHENNRESGSTFHPDHVKSNVTRANVRAELEAARKDGSLPYLQRGLPVPVKSTEPGKTREQVKREVANMTAAERRQLMDLGGGN